MNKQPMALAAIGFVLLEVVLYFFVDQPVANSLRDLDVSHPQIIDLFRAITDLAKSKWYVWPSGIILVFCAVLLRSDGLNRAVRQRIVMTAHKMLFFFSSIALSGIVTDIIKPILGRARPVEWMRDHAYGFHPLTFQAAWNAMPSGHATTAAALATALVILWPRGRMVWCFIGIILAVSRVMVNAHYVSDVLVGVLVGFIITLGVAHRRDDQGMFPKLNGIFPIDKSG